MIASDYWNICLCEGNQFLKYMFLFAIIHNYWLLHFEWLASMAEDCPCFVYAAMQRMPEYNITFKSLYLISLASGHVPQIITSDRWLLQFSFLGLNQRGNLTN